MEGVVDWSKNPFWDTLNIMLKSSNLKIPLFVFHLQSSFLISLRSSFDLNVIYSQSCGHLEAFGLPISPKSSSQQPCFWRSMKQTLCILQSGGFISCLYSICTQASVLLIENVFVWKYLSHFSQLGSNFHNCSENRNPDSKPLDQAIYKKSLSQSSMFKV